MQKRTIVLIAIISFFTILLIGGGVVLFQRLQSDKRVYSIDLHSFIPLESKSVIEIRRANELKNIDVNSKDSSLLQSISTEFSYPFYLVDFSEEEHVIVAKLSSSQEIEVRDILTNSLYPNYPPQKRTYKGAEVLFFTTNDHNEFFVCTFFNGIFIGAHNYKMVQNIIDTDASKALFILPFYQKTEHFFKSASLVYYGNSGLSPIIYSLNQRDSAIVVDGYIDKEIGKEQNQDSLVIDRSLFPISCEAFQIDQYSPNLTDSLSDIFNAPFYTFWVDSVSALFATKFDLSRYDLYDRLNAIEKQQTGKSLFRHGYTIGKKYSIYSGSSLFNQKVFNSDTLVYFAFKDGCLLYSNNKEIVRNHILKTEISSLELDIQEIGETFFYTQDPSKVTHPLLEDINLSPIFAGKKLTLKIFPDIEFYKIEISAKHF